jgi:hypothetical protein
MEHKPASTTKERSRAQQESLGLFSGARPLSQRATFCIEALAPSTCWVEGREPQETWVTLLCWRSH